MLKVYLPPYDGEICTENDAFFDCYCWQLKDTNEVHDVIKAIDKKRCFAGRLVAGVDEEPIELDGEKVLLALPVTFLSTGCKTVLNVIMFPETIFSVAECGENALREILKLKEGNIYLPYGRYVGTFDNSIEVIMGSKHHVVTTSRQLLSLLRKYFDSEVFTV